MPLLTYSVADFTPFTKIRSADVNSRFSEIATLLNVTKLDDDNLQDDGITRASKLKPGTADYVLINDATGEMSEEAQLDTTRGGLGFAPTLTGNGGSAVRVNSAGTALELGSPDSGTLVDTFSTSVATFIAAEDITAQDAVCAALNDGVYKLFRCDSDDPKRKFNFAGFAANSATTTAEVQTWTNSGAVTAGDSVTVTINGTPITESFDTDNDTTITNLASSIQAHADVDTAQEEAGASKRIITITGLGALDINMVVTGGAWTGGSAPTVNIVQVTPPSADTVKVHMFGLMGGFTGLETTRKYYVGTTAGSITDAPTDSDPEFTGQAINATTMFVNQAIETFNFTSSELYIKSHGQSAGSPTGSTTDTEHFDAISWSIGTSAPSPRTGAGVGNGQYGCCHHFIDGVNASAAIAAANHKYNRISWVSDTVRGTPYQSGGIVGDFNSKLILFKGSTTNVAGGGADDLWSWNGTSWTNEGATGTNNSSVCGTFKHNGKVSVVNGVTTGGANLQQHETWDGASFSTLATNSTGLTGFAGAGPGGVGMWCRDINPADSYEWNGSSWSAATSVGHRLGPSAATGQNQAANSGFFNGATYENGGWDVSSTVTTTKSWNGTSWTTEVGNTLARGGSQGSVI